MNNEQMIALIKRLDEMDSAITDPVKLHHAEDFIHNAVHMNVNPETVLDLVNSNEKIVYTGTHDEIESWLHDNWTNLNGQYTFAHNGMALHTFYVSQNTISTDPGKEGNPSSDEIMD